MTITAFSVTFSSEPWTAGLVNHLWQSTVVAGLAWLLALALRKNHARIRYWVWMAASVKFLLPFSLLIAAGGWLRSLIPAASVAQPSLASAMEQMTQPFRQTQFFETSEVPVAAHHETWLPYLLLMVWLCGALVAIGRFLRGWWTVYAAKRSARPLEFVAQVPVLSSSAPIEPGVVGIFRPVLLLPEGILERLNSEQMRAIVAHEMAHVRRRDNLTFAIHMIVEALFWFHPLVWWIGERLIDERECACDEAALGQGRSAETYAESILKICAFCLESPLACVSGIAGANLKRRIVQIMSRHFGKKLSLGKKLLLTTAGLVAIAGPLAFGVVRMIPIEMQILHATSPLPSYEVATIKPADDPIPGNPGRNVRRFTGTTKDLIEGAFNIPYGAGDRVVGGPGWISTDKYVIDGKIPDDLFARMRTMEGAESRTQNSLMKQSLLADRFKLKVHFEMQEMSVYALVVAKRGSGLKPTDPNASPTPLSLPAFASLYYANTFGPDHRLVVTRDAQGALEMTAKSMRMDNVAQSLEEVVDDVGGRTVVDRTGLDGQYDFKLKWAPQQDAPSADSAAVDAPSIFTALEEQLGLKLVPARGTVEVVVIDHIEKPTAN